MSCINDTICVDQSASIRTGLLLLSTLRLLPAGSSRSVVLVYAFASIDPPKVLFAGFLIYAISGVVYTLVEIRKRRKARKRGE